MVLILLMSCETVSFFQRGQKTSCSESKKEVLQCWDGSGVVLWLLGVLPYGKLLIAEQSSSSAGSVLNSSLVVMHCAVKGSERHSTLSGGEVGTFFKPFLLQLAFCQ